MAKPSLEELRNLIDRADASLLEAISAHLQLSLEVEEVKRQKGIGILDLGRSEKKRRQFIKIGAKLNPPLDETFCSNLWNLLHNFFLAQQSAQRQNAATAE